MLPDTCTASPTAVASGVVTETRRYLGVHRAMHAMSGGVHVMLSRALFNFFGFLKNKKRLILMGRTQQAGVDSRLLMIDGVLDRMVGCPVYMHGQHKHACVVLLSGYGSYVLIFPRSDGPTGKSKIILHC